MVRIQMLSKAKVIKRPILDVVFYQTTSGAEPVREWLKELPAHERHANGEDIKAVQFRWPLGMRHPHRILNSLKSGLVFKKRHHHAHRKQIR